MTHLRIPVDHLVNLVTMQLPKNNTAQPFYYDRQPTAGARRTRWRERT